MDRYICIHGHFYQPPRENPWLEATEVQDSAAPYHDWNERITAECYAPNAVSRILDGDGRIVRIVNNYAKMSFNFGPTLLAWLQAQAPDVYQAILDADRESAARFSGHGSAMAQAYNHMILPLANSRDKRTQILWGIRDFERRFRRAPEGMWLPETAVDLETLDLLAGFGLAFTILEPRQARRVRRLGARAWRDVSGGRIDPTMAYAVRLPSGRSLAAFFYDGPISRAVAFEGLLRSGEQFAQRLVGAFSDARAWPQLVHIATDGETYGHHHRFGDMALAYALHHIEREGLARLTNYGEYLERHPPTHEVEIVEHTSWSCAHGVERWRADCGDNTGMHPGWTQAWRAPLRAALDWLRDELAGPYAEHAGRLLMDPWAARDDYILVILNRSPESVAAFFARHAGRQLDLGEQVTALKLLELQRHAMLMYTSCGWFFDELSGIETVQVLQYAGRAVQLAQELFAERAARLEDAFLARLAEAKSNLPAHRDGAHIYQTMVRPAMVDREKVAAHYAISALFDGYPERAAVYCYQADRLDWRVAESGKVRLALGRARITSGITREWGDYTFGVLHFGDHNLSGGVRAFGGDEAYAAMVAEMTDAFARADFPEVLRAMDRHFGESRYSLKSLFRDEQRRILQEILDATLTDVEGAYRQIYEQYSPLMAFLTDAGAPLPAPFQAAAEFFLNTQLRRAFAQDPLDFDRIEQLLAQSRTWGSRLDAVGLEYTLRRTIERLAGALAGDPDDLTLLQRLDAAVRLARTLPFEVNFWKVQNLFYGLLQSAYPAYRRQAAAGAPGAAQWAESFAALGEKLSVRVDVPAP